MTSMTPASADYFAQNADKWDTLRSSYFTEAVRQAAICKAYLRSDMVVADVGAGTGFMAAGLAPLVKRVHVLDGSAEMLAIARQNLAAFDNLEYHTADGLHLPLPDASVDAVFANMYLHHCPDPLAAIQEMARLLKPGGRLVLTDMDAHTYEWFKDEMADVWLGFERPQIERWFEQAGLVNRLVTCSGQSCCVQSQAAGSDCGEDTEGLARVSVFLAVGAQKVIAQSAVGEHYSALAKSGATCCSVPAEAALQPEAAPVQKASACCSSSPAEANAPAASCCGSPADTNAAASSCCGGADLISLDSLATQPVADPFPAEYPEAERSQAPQEAAEFSLGCGNPLALAELQPGETVLDIGSGGGLDAFLSARKVGPGGRVIGVDMTESMLARARAAQAKAGIENVEFRYGFAQELPVEDSTVDVIISNCVINLTEDKGRVFKEAYRALKPGGRLEVSDMVTDGSFPAELRADPANWGGCVFGALPEQEYLDLIAQAGFSQAQVRSRSAALGDQGVRIYSAIVSARK